MEIVALDHLLLAIPAGGEEEARRFYGGLLGLAEIPKPTALASRGGCWFALPGAALHLGVEGDFRPARKAHPAFRVRDLEALRRRLETAGVMTHLDTTLSEVERFFCTDPFGNRLEFIQETSPSPAPDQA